MERAFCEEVVSKLWLGERKAHTEFTDGDSESRVTLLHKRDDDVLQYEVDASRVFENDRAVVPYRRSVPSDAMSEGDSLMATLSLLSGDVGARKRGRKPTVSPSKVVTLNGIAHA